MKLVFWQGVSIKSVCVCGHNAVSDTQGRVRYHAPFLRLEELKLFVERYGLKLRDDKTVERVDVVPAPDPPR
jgi:hypothetical protein